MKQNKLAFTLIELLVVITIIGILAVWATTIYTAQIQKARDTTRINDIKAMQSAIEQVYQDTAEYPHSDEFATWGMISVLTYMERIPSDPKTTQKCNWESSCDYIYTTWEDDNGIDYWVYEISTAFENEWNVTSRAGADWWGDDLRLEVWLDLSWTYTNHTWSITASWCTSLSWALNGTSMIKVAYNWCN